MKKENYDEPIYENLELYSGLDLVYRHPCLHFPADSHECSNCKYGKANKCKIDEEYRKIQKDLEILDIIKKWFMENITDYRNYDMTLFVDTFIRKDEPIFKILEEWLNNDK